MIATFSGLIGEQTWRQDTGWEFLKAHFLVPENPSKTCKALVIYAVLTGLNVEELKLTGSDLKEGNAPGLLLSEEYWK